ncbi:prevent-host-death family protein [Caulobacter sp. B11]|uniref:type II toxin-antitoxin system Phd/YefM family antitoxin n=1 Tax=Caulobacter sp. B11 TaxID=2048899 RepID=UPI000C12CFF2|nr:type II toxin-antitoxin system prevent-host-death family antitoxin [Caulobacter sp. B11]PHY13984.1 prevent-host-death family protein [Caulobacter sp. B11]
MEIEMSRYSLADARENLPRLIDESLQGQEVIITRHGEPIAEIRPLVESKPPSSPEVRAAAFERLLAGRNAYPPIKGMNSVELLNSLYDDPDG